jgi:hypothetical protein
MSTSSNGKITLEFRLYGDARQADEAMGFPENVQKARNPYAKDRIRDLTL